MKFAIKHQDSYSRGELLLRSFLGFIYIAIPHGILLMIFGIGAAIINFLSFWIILFTGKYPKGMFDYMVKVQRYGLRVRARLMNLADGYPAFGLDGEDDKTVFDVPYEEGKRNRLSVLARLLLGVFYVMIPHGICLAFMMIGAQIVTLIAWFAVLFTGKYPEGMHNFVVKTLRWATRVNLYMSFLSDKYPPFNGEEDEPVNFDGEKQVEEHLVD